MLRVGGLLSVLVALAVMAAPAGAAPPAPGAPGAMHTWAPADKHGFGTSHTLASHAYFTLRAASLTEIYYPDLSTPAFRGLQFVVTDGKTFADRETVDDDPRHIEPVAPGVSAHVEPDGSLAFRQVTRTSRWRLTKTWITDPARATVLARVRFESLTGRPLQLYVLADPAPGNDGNDDLGTSGSHELVAYDEAAATAVAATPGLRRTTSGYRGSASDPWRALEAMENLHPYDAVEPGNVVQAAATAVDGKRHQTMTLAIGFGRDQAAARATATRSLDGGFAQAERRYHEGWEDYRSDLARPPASVAGDAELRAVYEQSLLVLAASEDKIYRGASIASPSMPWIWGTLKLEPDQRSRARTTSSGLATSTTWPPRRRPRATTRRPTACWTTCGGCRSRPETGGRTRSSTARRSGRPSSSTRSRSRSCSPGGWAARARPTGRTSSGPPTTS